MKKKFLIPIIGLILCLLIGMPGLARVENFIMFIGQKVLGAVAGAPLSVSATGGLQSGIPFTQITSATATTCATSQTAITGITTTPVAGTYLITYSTDFNSANGGTTVTVNLSVGGTNVSITQRKFMPFAGGTLTSGAQRLPFSVTTIQVLNGSQILAANCVTSASTATTANSEMDIVRLL